MYNSRFKFDFILLQTVFVQYKNFIVYKIKQVRQQKRTSNKHQDTNQWHIAYNPTIPYHTKKMYQVQFVRYLTNEHSQTYIYL